MNLVPAWRPRPSWTLRRNLIVSGFRAFIDILYSTALMQPPSLEKAAQDAQKLGFVWVDPAPELVVGEIKEMAEANGVEAKRIAGFWYGPRGSDGAAGQKAEPGEMVIYHMHGGGYVMGTGHPSDFSMRTCFNGFLEFFPGKPRVFAVEYRLCSAPPFGAANPFPAPLIDAVAGYRYLLQLGFAPSQIIISGDSAGGHLAFALSRYLAMYAGQLPGLPPPDVRGLLLLSPTVDWAVTHTGPDSSMERNSRSDFVHTIFTSEYTKKALVGKLPVGTAETSPWISPASLHVEVTKGMLKGMPRTCIVSGAVEMTLDPMRTLRDRMRAELGEDAVVYIETPNATHDFFTASWSEPERTDTFKEVAQWVGSL